MPILLSCGCAIEGYEMVYNILVKEHPDASHSGYMSVCKFCEDRYRNAGLVQDSYEG